MLSKRDILKEIYFIFKGTNGLEIKERKTYMMQSVTKRYQD